MIQKNIQVLTHYDLFVEHVLVKMSKLINPLRYYSISHRPTYDLSWFTRCQYFICALQH